MKTAPPNDPHRLFAHAQPFDDTELDNEDSFLPDEFPLEDFA